MNLTRTQTALAAALAYADSLDTKDYRLLELSEPGRRELLRR